MEIRLSMRRWFVWPAATRRCCTHLSTPRVTSVRSIRAIWPMPPRVTPRRNSSRSAPNCSATLTPILLILWTTMTAPCRSLFCCRRRFQTCWFRPTWASPSAWRRISVRSIWPRSAGRQSRSSKTRTQIFWIRSWPRISRRAEKFSMTRPRCCRFMRRAAARSACGRNGAMSRKGT